MDCRRRAVLPALFLAGGVLGCTEDRSAQLTPEVPPPGAKIIRAADLPRQEPSASLCLAYADFYRRGAQDPAHPPGRRQELREQARVAYQQALDLEPENLRASLGLARLYEETGDHDRALETYHRAARRHGQKAFLWHELGLCHARQKEWEPALEALRQASELEPENRPYALTLGYTLARCGRTEESLDVFRRVVGEARGHYNIARMLHHLAQYEQARQHLHGALQADPQLADARELLARLESGATQGTDPFPTPVGFASEN